MGPEWIVVGIIAVAVIFGATTIPDIDLNVGRAQGALQRGMRGVAVADARMSRPASCHSATTAPGGWPVTSAWYNTSIAIRRASRRLPTSALHAFDVLARARVDLDALTLLDEQWHLDDRTGLHLSRLHRSRPCVTLRPRIRLDDREHDGGGELDGDRLALVHRDLRLTRLGEVPGRVAHDLARHVHLFVRVPVHEHVLTAVRVQVLHRLAFDDRKSDLHASVERLLDDRAGLDVPELRTHERSSLAGFHVLELDHLEQGSVEVQRHTVLEIVRGDAHPGSLTARSAHAWRPRPPRIRRHGPPPCLRSGRRRCPPGRPPARS